MLTEYGKTIKKRLIDLDKTQEWLLRRVREDTDKYFDDSYLWKIMHGKLAPKNIVAAILLFPSEKL